MLQTVLIVCHQHNLWLALLAVGVCAVSSGTALQLLLSTRRAPKKWQLLLLGLAGAYGGAGAWATHFIAELAYNPGMRTTYDLALTLWSLAIALVGGATWVIASLLTLRPWRYPMAATSFALSAGAMQYVGMAAMRMRGTVVWDPAFVLASLAIGGLLAAASFRTVARSTAGFRFPVAAALMVSATAGLHILAVAGTKIVADPNAAVVAGSVNREALAFSVGAATVLVGLTGLATLWLEARSRATSLAVVHSIFEAMPQAVGYFDENDQFVMGNESYHREMAQVGVTLRAGMPYEAMLRVVAGRAFGHLPPEQIQALIRDRLESRRGVPFDRDEETVDGRCLRLQFCRTDRGGMVTVITDITSLKRQSEDLAAARDAAQAADRTKSAFLANMSHELRTPMNGIIAVAELLGEQSLNPAQTELLGLIRSSGARLNRVLSDVLDRVTVARGDLEIVSEPFDLIRAVSDASVPIRLEAEAKGLTFNLDLKLVRGDQPFTVIGDGSRLKQVLGHLLANAVKFTERGGLDLIVEPAAGGGPDDIEFKVLDTGIGFDPFDAERLFNAFELGDASNTRRFGGMGLGLSIARELVVRMGGVLRCESIPGEGSVFSVTLPLTKTSTAARPSAAPAALAHDVPLTADMGIGSLQAALAEAAIGPRADGAAVTSETPEAPEAPEVPEALEASEPPTADGQGVDATPPVLLVVDDNATNQRLLALILQGAGMQVRLADNGLEGLEAYQAAAFDAVLMDIQMPVMDGLEATAAIRAFEVQNGRRRTPILIVSANAAPENIAAGRAAGADGHLSKPVTAARLLDALAQLGDSGEEDQNSDLDAVA